jgi:hypothetical protein
MTEFARRALPRLVIVAFAAIWTWAVYSHHASVDYAAPSAYVSLPTGEAYASPAEVGADVAGYGCSWSSRDGFGCYGPDNS